MEIRGPPELTSRGTLSIQHNSCPSFSTAELASNGVEVHNFSSSGYITWSFGSHPDSVNILANVLRHLITSRKEGITKSSSFSHRSPSHDQFAALRRTSSCAVINSTVNREAIPLCSQTQHSQPMQSNMHLDTWLHQGKKASPSPVPSHIGLHLMTIMLI